MWLLDDSVCGLWGNPGLSDVKSVVAESVCGMLGNPGLSVVKTAVAESVCGLLLIPFVACWAIRWLSVVKSVVAKSVCGLLLNLSVLFWGHLSLVCDINLLNTVNTWKYIGGRQLVAVVWSAYFTS